MATSAFPQVTCMKPSSMSGLPSVAESDTAIIKNTGEKYDFSAIPVFLSTHYFFLDKRFSPFVNLRFGGFGLFGEKNVDTKEKYSLSSKKPDFNLFVSPGIGVKMHITPSIGILVSINDDAYLVNAFDTNKNDYKNKLIQDLGINIGVCFQIKGW